MMLHAASNGWVNWPAPRPRPAWRPKAFRSRHAELQKRYAGRAPVRVFYQIWNQPLSTVNGEQLISDVMRLCGAENIFAQLTLPAPIVTIEAILVANPEAIVASAMDGTRPTWLDMWSHWRDLTATRRNNLFFIPADLINRHSPRILDGATRMCEQMDKVRSKRPGTRPATAQGPANRPHSALP
jgi:iron complex transport system substrate-binding protein